MAELITSRANPLFKQLAASKRRARKGSELMLIEGPKLLEEALQAGVFVLEVAFAGTPQAPAPEALLERARAAGATIRRLEASLLAGLSELESCQGVLALAREPRPADAPADVGPPLALAATGVQNPGNLGALLRSAEAAGATAAWLAAGCADPFSWKSLRGAMGSAFRLPLHRGLPEHELVDALRSQGLRVLAADPRGDQRYDRMDYRGPVAVLLGGEGAGLGRELLEAADARVAIPLRGAVESLNVAVAAGLLLFEAARQRRNGQDARHRGAPTTGG
jgi:RNA methyltransferase, TrmH family